MGRDNGGQSGVATVLSGNKLRRKPGNVGRRMSYVLVFVRPSDKLAHSSRRVRLASPISVPSLYWVLFCTGH